VLQPKRVKYRKTHKGKRRGKAHAGNTVVFGEFGLQATETCWMTARQIESARRVMVRYLRRGGKMWIRVFPDKSVTKKPAETRMGSGKGAPDHWVAVIKPGRMLFEISGIRESMAQEAMHLASYKLPISTRFVVKEGFGSGGQS
jgi:large subunit ribosomal protein L16